MIHSINTPLSLYMSVRKGQFIFKVLTSYLGTELGCKTKACRVKSADLFFSQTFVLTSRLCEVVQGLKS